MESIQGKSSMYTSAKWFRSANRAALFFAISAACLAQKDPGIRQGPPGAGGALNGLTPVELSMFNEGLQRAIQLESVCDDCNDVTLGSFIDQARQLLSRKRTRLG
jgi:hypothetical protein